MSSTWGFFLHKLIGCIAAGSLTVQLPSGERIEHRAKAPGPDATLALHDWKAIRRLMSGGDVGFAEAYMEGEWSTPDLTALIELVAINQARLEAAIAGILPMRVFNRVRHWLRDNSKAGSKRNISFHYDLGNEFYKLWLDPSMTYSSALYASPDQTLEAAQQNKLDRIAEKLDLKGGEEVLEIGCGWGALASTLAKRQARVTGLTLSKEQLAFAQDRIAAEKLDDQVDLRLEDYRDTGGLFDRIVSIEMIEAVGERHWPEYFGALRSHLKAGGRAVLQAITIDESKFEGYRRAPDFIQRYIFPGGMLPTKTALAEQAAKAGLRLSETENFADSYALTLAEWRRRFEAAWPQIEPQGFNSQFRRLWEYYLCYCEAGFKTRAIDVGLYTLTG